MGQRFMIWSCNQCDFKDVKKNDTPIYYLGKISK